MCVRNSGISARRACKARFNFQILMVVYSYIISRVALPRVTDASAPMFKLECSAGFFCRRKFLMVADLFHFGDDQFQLFVFRVKVGRDPDAGARPVIDDEFSMNQFLSNRGRVVMPRSERAATLQWIFGTGDVKSSFGRQLNQALSLSYTLFANCGHANLVNDL